MTNSALCLHALPLLPGGLTCSESQILAISSSLENGDHLPDACLFVETITFSSPVEDWRAVGLAALVDKCLQCIAECRWLQPIPRTELRRRGAPKSKQRLHSEFSQQRRQSKCSFISGLAEWAENGPFKSPDAKRVEQHGRVRTDASSHSLAATSQ